ncbi:SDR family NAD(P)-dependent oxidoreductase [bacterium]|nr:SDR family NAD(P)-dependent oxidoreductase [bacterium]
MTQPQPIPESEAAIRVPIEDRRQAVVTGAGGFIGSHLVEELLANGWRVKALVHYNALGSEGHLTKVRVGLAEEARSRLEIVHGDVADSRCVRGIVDGASAVFHLAALIGIPYSYVAPHSYVTTNITGTLNVLEACRDCAVPRMIHTSTSEVYGTAVTTPMAENHPLQAQSPYAASKIAADKLAESWFRSFGLPVVTVRPFNTFGPRQSMRAVIPTIIAQALSEKCSVVRLGALDPVRDLTFVRDTARGFRVLAEAPAEKVVGRVFNLGTGRGISVGSLAAHILNLLGIQKPVEEASDRRRPAASEVLALISDYTRIRREIGWKPEISLDEGIRQTTDYLRPLLKDLPVEEYVR